MFRVIQYLIFFGNYQSIYHDQTNVPCTHPLLVAQLLVLVVVGCAVDLGDGDGVVVGVLAGQLVPGGGEALAVAAPGSEELHEGHARLGAGLK